MKLWEIYTDVLPTNHARDFRKPSPNTDIEKKIGDMERDIERDEIESDIEVPIHMRNEYYDDEYEDVADDQTEIELLDIELDRFKNRR